MHSEARRTAAAATTRLIKAINLLDTLQIIKHLAATLAKLAPWEGTKIQYTRRGESQAKG
eukprot:1163732-Pleurochrysis_carterae.AAC.2